MSPFISESITALTLFVQLLFVVILGVLELCWVVMNKEEIDDSGNKCSSDLDRRSKKYNEREVELSNIMSDHGLADTFSGTRASHCAVALETLKGSGNLSNALPCAPEGTKGQQRDNAAPSSVPNGKRSNMLSFERPPLEDWRGRRSNVLLRGTSCMVAVVNNVFLLLITEVWALVYCVQVGGESVLYWDPSIACESSLSTRYGKVRIVAIVIIVGSFVLLGWFLLVAKKLASAQISATETCDMTSVGSAVSVEGRRFIKLQPVQIRAL